MFTSAPRDLALADYVVINTNGSYAFAKQTAKSLITSNPMLAEECSETVGAHLYALILAS